VNIYNESDKLFSRRIHRLVLEAFIGPSLERECNHKDGNKLNNDLKNLEWVTHQENINHAVKEGLHPRGERVHTSKFTEDQVREIRELCAAGFSNLEISEMYDVARQTIGDIKQYRKWVHI